MLVSTCKYPTCLAWLRLYSIRLANPAWAQHTHNPTYVDKKEVQAKTKKVRSLRPLLPISLSLLLSLLLSLYLLYLTAELRDIHFAG